MTQPSEENASPKLVGVFNQLINPLQRAIAKAGYTTPTPIQEQSIPELLNGRDLIGCAQTGTGKTAAFTLPLLQLLRRNRARPTPGLPRALIMTPTRELAAQVEQSIGVYGKYLKLSHTVIFGGVKQYSQVRALQSGRDILVATPGRLLDLIDQGHLALSAVEVFVLDEADRMLDMGFLPDIKKVIEMIPKQRQTLFFSATMADEVVTLANTLVKDPAHITVSPERPAVERIEQKVYFVDKKDKLKLLLATLRTTDMEKVIIFTRTRHGADRVTQRLNRAKIKTAAIHSDKSQNARTRALRQFNQGYLSALVGTDIAARGLDIDNVSHVINYDLPNETENYVHRIGRTARAGAEGDAISFCAADERDYLRSIEKLIGHAVPVIDDHEFHSDKAMHAKGVDAKPPPRQGNKHRSQSGRNKNQPHRNQHKKRPPRNRRSN